MVNRKAALLGVVALIIVAIGTWFLGHEDYKATEGRQENAGEPATIPEEAPTEE